MTSGNNWSLAVLLLSRKPVGRMSCRFLRFLQEQGIVVDLDCHAMTALISGGLNELALTLVDRDNFQGLEELIERQLQGFKKYG